MYTYNEEEKKIDFSHNPFSKPQIDIDNYDDGFKEFSAMIVVADFDANYAFNIYRSD